MISNPLTFGSLFAGIGGFDLGFERAGMVCKWQVEIDSYANLVLTKHWPDVPKFRDVRAFPPGPDSPWLGANWRERFEVDAICGGFPCQDISYAGQGAGLDGKRSGLFFEAIRVVRELRPKVVVLENVAALLTRGMDRVCGTLAEIGYDAEWHCIPASAVGAPHERDRVFIIAHSESQRQRTRWTRGIAGIGPRKEDSANVADSRRERPRTTEELDRKASVRSEGSIDVADSGWWETEPEVDRVANGIPNCVDQLRGLGNAIVPQVAELVANRVLELVQ